LRRFSGLFYAKTRKKSVKKRAKNYKNSHRFLEIYHGVFAGNFHRFLPFFIKKIAKN